MLDGAAALEAVETLNTDSDSLLKELALTVPVTDVSRSTQSTDKTTTIDLSVVTPLASDSDRVELVFIDSRVDLETVDSFASDRIFSISADDDAFAKMADIAVFFGSVDAIHVISHGADGELQLGNQTYTSSNLDAYQTSLTLLGSSLTESGDLLFYACDLAASEKGVQFIESLSTITGADIAASDDVTGVGGDSDLEVSEGDIGTDELALADLLQTSLSTETFTQIDLSGENLQIVSYAPLQDFGAPVGTDQLGNTNTGIPFSTYGYDDPSNINDGVLGYVLSPGVANGSVTIDVPNLTGQSTMYALLNNFSGEAKDTPEYTVTVNFTTGDPVSFVARAGVETRDFNQNLSNELTSDDVAVWWSNYDGINDGVEDFQRLDVRQFDLSDHSSRTIDSVTLTTLGPNAGDVAMLSGLTFSTGVTKDWSGLDKSGTDISNIKLIDNSDLTPPDSTALTPSLVDGDKIDVLVYTFGAAKDLSASITPVFSDNSTYTITTLGTAFDSSTPNYDLIIVQEPSPRGGSFIMTDAERSYLAAQLDRGARIMIVGENGDWGSGDASNLGQTGYGVNPTVTATVADLGGSIEVDATYTLSSSYGLVSNTAANGSGGGINNHEITAGVTSITFGSHGGLNIDPDITEPLVVDRNQRVVMAEQAISNGRLFIVADFGWLNTVNAQESTLLKNAAINAYNNIKTVAAGGDPNYGYGLANTSPPYVFDPGSVFSADEKGAGLEFPGDDSSLDLQSFTIELWVKPSSTSLDWQPLFMKTSEEGLTANRNFSIWMVNGNSKYVCGSFNTAAGQVELYSNATGLYLNGVSGTATELTLDAWNHVAFSYDYSSGTAKLIINDVVSSSGTVQAGYEQPTNNDHPLYIGGLPSGYASLGAFTGDIADVRIYDTALTGVQISENKTEVVTGDEANLVFATRLASNAQNEVLDLVSGTYSGSFFEGLTGSADGNVSDPGAYVQAQISTPEDNAYSILAADFSTNFLYSASDSSAFTAVKVTSLPSSGDLTLDGVAVVAGQVINLSAMTGDRLRYTPDTNFSGAESFQWKAVNAGGSFSNVVSFGITVEPSAGISNAFYREGADPLTIADSYSFSTAGTYADGYLKFTISANGDSNDVLSISSNETPDALGAVSVSNGFVYIGTGVSRELVGSIDAVADGTDGNPLKINFSAALPNAGFENVTNGVADDWTFSEQFYGTRYTDTSQGETTNGELDLFGVAVSEADEPTITNSPYDGNETFTPTYSDVSYGETDTNLTSVSNSVSIDLTSGVGGSNALKLTSAWFITDRTKGSIHGPYATSSAFEVQSGDALYLDFKALKTFDDYEVFGLLRAVNADGSFVSDSAPSTDPSADNIILFAQRGSDTNGYVTVSKSGLQAGSYKFQFVGGSYDRTGYRGLGSELYVDNIRLVSGSGVNASDIQAIARSVQYSSLNTRQVAAGSTIEKTVSISVVDGSQTTQDSSSLTVVIQDDPQPSISAVTGVAKPYSKGSGLPIDVVDSVTAYDLKSATVSVSNNFEVGDYLSLTNDSSTMGDIEGVYSTSTGVGVLTLTSSLGATDAQWAAAIDAVQYYNVNADQSLSTRTISFVGSASDGDTSTAVSVDVSVTNAVSAPTDPAIINSSSVERLVLTGQTVSQVQGVASDGTYYYINDSGQNLRVFDMSGAHVQSIAASELPETQHSLTYTGGYLFYRNDGTAATGDGALYARAVDNLSSLITVSEDSSYPLPQREGWNSWNILGMPDGRLAVLGENGYNSSSGFYEADVTFYTISADRTQLTYHSVLTLKDTENFLEYFHGIETDGDHLFIMHWTGGVQSNSQVIPSVAHGTNLANVGGYKSYSLTDGSVVGNQSEAITGWDMKLVDGTTFDNPTYLGRNPLTGSFFYADYSNGNQLAVSKSTSIAATEDIAASISASDFSTIFTTGTLGSIEIQRLPVHGTLTLSGGTAVSVGDVLTASQQSQLIYTPDSEFSGVDSILWIGYDTDSSSWSSQKASVITVGNVEDDPVFSVTSSNPYSLNFDGSGDYLDAGVPLLNDLSTFTVSFWINPDDATTSARQSLVGQNDTFEIFLERNTSVPTLVFWNDTAGNVNIPLTGLSNGEWAHIGIRGDSVAGLVEVFVNGVFAAKGTHDSSATYEGYDANSAAKTMKVGGYVQDDSNANYFAGSLDEISIWNVALSDSGMQSLTTQKMTGSETGLIGFWSADEGTGSNVANRISGSDGSTDLTINGNPQWEASTLRLDGLNFVVGTDTSVLAGPAFSVTDVDSALESVEVKISTNLRPGDLLAFSNDGLTMGNIAASAYDSSTGVLTLTSSGSTASFTQWEAALSAVRFATTAEVGESDRTITWTVSDGINEVTDSSRITVVYPSILGTTASGYIEGNPAGAVLMPYAYLPADLGANISGLQVYIDNPQSGDVLSVTGSSDDITTNYSSASGRLTFSGTASRADYQALLRTVVFNSTSTNLDDRTIVLQVSEHVSLNFGGKSHYYQYVAGNLSWTAAKAAAETNTMVDQGGNVLTGYLVTVTSEEENDFIQSKLAANAWMGATDNDTYGEGNWTWVTGPEAGTKFFQGPTNPGSGTISSNYGSAVGGAYNAWASGEPNNWGGDEDYAHFYAANGSWNDYPHVASISGYVVEYNSATEYQPIGGQFTLSMSPNTAPTLTLTSANGAHIEGGSATPIISSVNAISDVEFDVSSVRVELTTGKQSGDALSFADVTSKFTSTYANGLLTITASDPSATSTDDWKAELTAITFSSAVAGPDSRTITWKAYDAGGKASTAVSTTVAVTTVNASPTIPDSYETLTATGIAEDVDPDTDNNGQLISVLFANSFADIDKYTGGSEALAGIAIVADASTSTQGSWQYYDGSDWNDVGSVSSTSALMLGASTKLRFNPAQDYNGSPGALTARVVDTDGGLTFTTSGSRQTLNVSAAAATDGVSSDSAVISITVTAEQDDPSVVIANGALEIGVNKPVSVDFSSYFREVDTDAFSYAVTDAPAGLTIDATTGVLSGSVARSGDYTLTVEATSDGVSGPETVSATYVLTVKKPVIAAPSTPSTVDIPTPTTSIPSIGGNAGVGGFGGAGSDPTNQPSVFNPGTVFSPTTSVTSTSTVGGFGSTSTNNAPGFSANTLVSQMASGQTGLGGNSGQTSFTARLAQVTSSTQIPAGGGVNTPTGTPSISGAGATNSPTGGGIAANPTVTLGGGVTTPGANPIGGGLTGPGGTSISTTTLGGGLANNTVTGNAPGKSAGGLQGGSITGSTTGNGNTPGDTSINGGAELAGTQQQAAGGFGIAAPGGAPTNGADGGNENFGFNAPPLGGVGGPSSAERSGQGDGDFAGFGGQPGTGGANGDIAGSATSNSPTGTLARGADTAGSPGTASGEGATTTEVAGIGNLAFAPQAGGAQAANGPAATAGANGATTGGENVGAEAANAATGVTQSGPMNGADAGSAQAGSQATIPGAAGDTGTAGGEGAAEAAALANAPTAQTGAEGQANAPEAQAATAGGEASVSGEAAAGGPESQAGAPEGPAAQAAANGGPAATGNGAAEAAQAANAPGGADGQAAGGDADVQTATAEQAGAQKATESVIDPTTGVVDAKVSNALMKMGTTMTRQIDRVVVQVGADGQVDTSTLARNDAENPSGLQIVRVTQVGRSIEADLADNGRAQVQEYQAVLVAPDGSQQPLPDWIKIDAETGKLTGEPPAGVDSINLAIKAVDANGESRVLILNLNVAEGAAVAPAEGENLGFVEPVRSHGTERFTEQLKRSAQAVA